MPPSNDPPVDTSAAEEITADREPVVASEPPPMPPAASTPSTSWIADEDVIFLRPDGARVPGRIAVAAPVLVHDHDHYTCMISLDGMRDDFTNREKPVSVHGETALQALLLALRFMGRMLRVFLDRGGRVLYVGGEGDDDGVGDIDMPLDAFFGPLLVDRNE